MVATGAGSTPPRRRRHAARRQPFVEHRTTGLLPSRGPRRQSRRSTAGALWSRDLLSGAIAVSALKSVKSGPPQAGLLAGDDGDGLVGEQPPACGAPGARRACCYAMMVAILAGTVVRRVRAII
jgi:hypothetical protein